MNKRFYICTIGNKQIKKLEIMTKQYQIQEYINRNVSKTTDELGNLVWATFDARDGYDFHSETYAEAVSVFVRNWDNLTENEKNNC